MMKTFLSAFVFCMSISTAYAQAPLSPEQELLARVAEKQQAQDASTEAPTTADTTATAPTPAVEEKPQPKAEPWLSQLGNTKFKPLYQSIFFRAEDVQMTQKILVALKNGGDSALINELLPKDDPIQEMIKEAEVKPKRASPVFFVSSFVYENANQWSAWVSGKKLGPDTLTLSEDMEVEVVNVTNQAITLAWQPENIDEMKTRFESSTRPENDPTLGKQDSAVWMGDDGRLRVRLRSNQSFYAFDMQIREGLPFRNPNMAHQFFWPPAMIEVPKPAEGQQGQPGAAGAAGATPSNAINIPRIAAAEAAGQTKTMDELKNHPPTLNTPTMSR